MKISNSHFIENFWKEFIFEDLPLTYKQYLTLDLLQKNKKCLMNQLSRDLKISLSTATENVARLIAKELLKKERDKRDRRKVWVSLTCKGKEVLRTVKKEKAKILDEIHKSFSQLEHEILGSIIAKINSLRKNIISKEVI